MYVCTFACSECITSLPLFNSMIYIYSKSWLVICIDPNLRERFVRVGNVYWTEINVTAYFLIIKICQCDLSGKRASY